MITAHYQAKATRFFVARIRCTPRRESMNANTGLEGVRRMREERSRRESLPKPVAMAVDFVSSMCEKQPPADVVRLLRKYEEKLQAAERELANNPRSVDPRDLNGSGNSGEDAQYAQAQAQAQERARQALEEAERASQEAARLLELALREAERREREEEQRRTEEQRRRDDDERRAFDERQVRDREYLAELATSAVIATETALQAIKYAEASLAESQLAPSRNLDASQTQSAFQQSPKLEIERPDA
jgi:hypothetical protein